MDVRVPPHSLEAESVVLCAALFSAADRAELMAVVKADHFYAPAAGDLWGILCQMVAADEPIESTTVVEFAKQQGKLEAIGGVDNLLRIAEYVSSTPMHFAGIMHRHWMQRQLIYVGQKLVSDAYDGNQSPDELLSALSDSVIELQTSGKDTGEVSLSDSLRETIKGLDAKSQSSAGVNTGFEDLDNHLGGFRDGQLIVLAARPAVGKSALALNISKNIAAAGGGVLFISMEMSHQEQTERLLAAESSVDSRSILTGQLSEMDRIQVVRSAKSLHDVPLYYLDQAFDADTIINTTRSLHQKRGLSLVVCDYLQLCEVNGVPEQFRERAVAKLSRSFKRLAQQLGIPVLALSQLNRDVEKRQSKRPVLSDLRESGAIEQDANVVMFLHRPDVYDPEDRPGEAEVIIGKNRNGADGTVRLSFQKEFTRFENRPVYDGGL